MSTGSYSSDHFFAKLHRSIPPRGFAHPHPEQGVTIMALKILLHSYRTDTVTDGIHNLHR